MLKLVDLQTIMPRSIDLQREQQTHNIRPMVDQQETTKEVVKQSLLRQEQVQQNQASGASTRIRSDANDEGQKGQDRRYRRFIKKKKSPLKTEPDKGEELERGQHIDITI